MVSTTEELHLPELEAVFGDRTGPIAGEAFKPSDPMAEAAAQAPTGLTALVEEDLDSIEAEQALQPVEADAVVAAVDAGVVRNGNTADGMIGAVRAAAVIHRPRAGMELRTFRPGTFYISSRNRLSVLHQAGIALGKADFFVEVDDEGRPVAEKT